MECQVQHLTLADGIASHTVRRVRDADPGSRLGEQLAIGKYVGVNTTGLQIVGPGTPTGLCGTPELDIKIIVQLGHRHIRLRVIRHTATRRVARDT
ncbi:hypothetical protein D3C78_1297170 [compost metagenome]